MNITRKEIHLINEIYSKKKVVKLLENVIKYCNEYDKVIVTT